MTIMDLWLPILVSGAAIWIASFVVWAVLPYHRSDYGPLPDEEAARRLLRNVPAGAYNLPNLPSRKDMETPEGRKKMEEGPVALMHFFRPGPPKMGAQLAQWLVFTLGVSVVIAYVTSRTLPAGTSYLEVFRVSGTLAFVAYGAATVQESVWFGRPWSNTFKQLFDALLYGLITAGIFGAFWPGR